MKELIRCLARIKVRRRWEQCTHAQGHGGRHCYRSKKDGYRFFTEAQARYWPVTTKGVKRKMYDAHPTPIDAHLELKLPHVYGGYFVDPRDGSDTGDGSPARPLKTNEAAKLLYLKHGVRCDLVTQESPALKEATKLLVDAASKVTRVPVKFDFTGLNWDFIQLMAEIVPYADAKYTSFAQYALKRLTGQASPLNHVFAHGKQFIMGEPYDHFDGKPERHLAAIAYNAMMEYLYVQIFGYVVSPISIAEAKRRVAQALVGELTKPDDLIAKKRKRR